MRVAALDVPLLIVHGTADPCPHCAVDSLADALPRATVHKLSDLGHLPWLEDPAPVRAMLRAFIQEVS
jgi:pimeloyl-ACP methyl ester carboxylesterase